MKLLAVLSGGMDSAAAMALMISEGHDVSHALTFNYGSKHNDREYISATRICRYYSVDLKRVSLDFIANHFKSDLLKTGGEIPEGHYADPSMQKTVVPFRNGIMLAVAAGYAESIGAEGIVIGNHFGDHAVYPDCRPDFIEHMGLAINYGTYADIRLFSPFCNSSKTDIAKVGNQIGVPFGMTWSCYKGGDRHCGVCGTCYERKEAFQEAGLVDPTVYVAATSSNI